MLYREWRETGGKNVWYDTDGNSNTISALDYGYPEIYRRVTQQADIYFQDWEIPDNPYFPNEFYTMVPEAWLKFKTELEFLLGTLDGKTISPDVFEAGYTRTTESGREVNSKSSTEQTLEGRDTATLGARDDTSVLNEDNKNRDINYIQGVQGVEPAPGNIGELGIGKASSMKDALAKNQSSRSDTYGEQVNTNTNNSTNNTDSTQGGTENFQERVTEKRINYYDNLAFTKERWDRLKELTPFYSYFKKLFSGVWSNELGY